MNKAQVLHEVAVLSANLALDLNAKAQQLYESGAIDTDSYLSGGGTEMICGGRSLAQILLTASLRDLVDSRMHLATKKTLTEFKNLKHF